MLYATAARLKRTSQPSRDEAVTSDPVDIVETNALIESFATHARAVALFLYPEATNATYKNAVKADEYVADPERWRRDRGALPPLLREVIDRTAKEIAHLTVDRHPEGSPAKGWSPDHILETFLSPLRTFAAQAAPGRLDARLTDFLANIPSAPQPLIMEVTVAPDLSTERLTARTDVSTTSSVPFAWRSGRMRAALGARPVTAEGQRGVFG